MSFSSLLRRSGRIVFGVLWVLVAAEIFIRIFAPQPLLPRFIQAGEFGIRVNMPNQKYTHWTPEYSIEIRTNSKGIRSKHEIPYEKPKDVKRIVVLGDSFAMGYGVNLQDTFTEQARSRLENAMGQKVEIVNLAVSGYGTAEDLIALKNEGVKYHPDLVLVTWHRTDMDDNLRSRLFSLEKDHLVRANTTYLPAVRIRQILFSYSAYRWLAANSHLYSWVRDSMARVVKRKLVAKGAKEKKGETISRNNATSYRVALAAALLEELKRVSDKYGAPLLIFDIPAKAGDTEYRSSMPEVIRDKFRVVSPIKAFEIYPEAKLYWEKSANHFTPLGCKIVGQVLADVIIRNSLLTEDYAEFPERK